MTDAPPGSADGGEFDACPAGSRRLVAEALARGMQRRRFGERPATLRLVQAMPAESRAAMLAACRTPPETARVFDRAGEAPGSVIPGIACCRLVAGGMIGRAADHAMQIHGGAGAPRGTSVERLCRDVRRFRVFESARRIQQGQRVRDVLRGAAGHG